MVDVDWVKECKDEVVCQQPHSHGAYHKDSYCKEQIKVGLILELLVERAVKICLYLIFGFVNKKSPLQIGLSITKKKEIPLAHFKVMLLESPHF